jgi:hypothetical protein
VTKYTVKAELRMEVFGKGLVGLGVEVTRSKIHSLAYRFSIDISLQGLVYGFLSQSPGFPFGNHKHLAKVFDLVCGCDF